MCIGIWIRVVAAMTALVASAMAFAAGVSLGLGISVEGDGFFLNPVVSKITVTKVESASLAEKAGIVQGDEIIQIEGQVVKGRRAADLKGYMSFGPGETRTLLLKHASGDTYTARLTKPPP